MKRIIAASLAAVMLMCITTAAGVAGSSSDPLVTKSYIEGTYTPNLTGEAGNIIDSELSELLSAYEDKLEMLYAGIQEDSSFKLTEDYIYVKIPAGSTVTVAAGGSFVLLSGAVSTEVVYGEVLNIATAKSVSTGDSPVLKQRYFCVEESKAVYTAAVDSYCAVDGYYKLSDTAERVLTEFFDVSESDWFYSSVRFVYENELYYDLDDVYFRPLDNTTRATFVYALWKASGSPEAELTNEYSDLTEDWYKTAVSWASKNGIVKGYDGGLFGPDDDITREQIAVFMYRYTQYLGGDVSAAADITTFVDYMEVSDWAYRELQWANATGLMIGIPGNKLSPWGMADRSQVATVLERYLSGSNT